MKKQYFVEKKAGINAPVGDIYQVLADVAHWHTWTPSITAITILGGGMLRPGAGLQILQPKLPRAVWAVTAVEQGAALVWEKKSFGLKMVSGHFIAASAGKAVVTLRISYSGALAGLFYVLTHNLTSQYMQMEIEGLKKHCEAIGGAI